MIFRLGEPRHMWLLVLFLVVGITVGLLPELTFNGRVLNDRGEPIEGAQVQFWHTDHNGRYKHPGCSVAISDLVDDFQYFGTATTAQDGSYQFLTYRPGIYSARPVTHIHVKVWIDGNVRLTSQFYFLDEDTSFDQRLQLEMQEQEDGSLVTEKDIVLNMGLGGTEAITPSQLEGPFYPVIDFFGFDSDMRYISTTDGTFEPAEATTDAPTEAPEGVDATASPADTNSPTTSPTEQKDGTTSTGRRTFITLLNLAIMTCWP